MKAVYITEYGNAQKLMFGNIAKPVINADQVLIKVQGAGVNPVDWMVREGFIKDSGQHTLPLTLGWDAAGEVVERGVNVEKFELGERVFVYAPISEQGAYAEYLAVDSNLVATAPKTLDTITAAAVPLAATTAWQSLMEGCQLRSGQRILIHNAAGGVGSFAVQIAKTQGAYVIGTASADKESYVRDLGVDEFIDYHSQRFEDIVDNIDAVLVAVGGDSIAERSLNVVRKGGHVVSLLDEVDETAAQKLGVNFRRWWVSPSADDLQHIAGLIDDGIVQVKIDKVFPLSQASKAHELSESKRARGKIVLDVSA
jgi:NADPH:quinone reductase-like Zn-dependent oxidoreductase